MKWSRLLPLPRLSLSRSNFILLGTLLGSQLAQASISLDIDNQGREHGLPLLLTLLTIVDSIKNAAQTAATGMLQYYTGYRPGDVPGNLPDPYYWWEAGAMFGALVEYWYYTGDSQWNDITTQALLHQTGSGNNFMPTNQSRTLGNDDQAFWGLSAMSAAEVRYPNPPEDQPQWLALAQAVFNTQVPRWNEQKCGGGLKWQIYSFNGGFNYRNTISNGCFFNLAARLAVYTGNESYAAWAEDAWDWMFGVGLASRDFHFFDGTDDRNNCSEVNHIQWSYNTGVMLLAAANMYHFTGQSDAWKSRVEGIVKGLDYFFPDGKNVMSEVACETQGTCNVDQRSFKAYLSRWIAATVQIAPFTHDMLMPKLRASAQAAALQCNGPNNVCGLRWTNGANYDGSTGVGEQMAAMEVFQTNLVDSAKKRVTAEHGGISKGDPDAGTEKDDDAYIGVLDDSITTADRAGAWILTILVILVTFAGIYFMVT